MADKKENESLGGFFAQNKTTTMKAAKNAKATEARKSIPSGVKGRAVLTGIAMRRTKDNKPYVTFSGNAVTPEEYKGYPLYPTFWLEPGDKGNDTVQDLIEEFIGALLCLAPDDLKDKVRDTFASGKTAEIDKLCALIVKGKPQFMYSTWGKDRVNYNFDGPVTEEESGDGEGDDDGTTIDDSAEESSGDDYGTGDDDAPPADDGGEPADDDVEPVQEEEEGPGFEVGHTVSMLYKGKKVKVKVLTINTEKKTAKVQEVGGERGKFETPWAKLEA